MVAKSSKSATEVVERMEDGFVGYLEDCVSGELRREMRRVARKAGLAVESAVPQVAKGMRFARGGGLVLSVQGSCIHASEPRLSVPYEYYEKFGVALVRDGKFVSVARVLGARSGVQKKMKAYFNGQVYEYVPKAVVQELFEALQGKYGCVTVE